MSTFLQIAQNMADRLDRDRPTTIYNADLSLLSQTIRRYREHINTAYNMVKLGLNRTDEYRQTSTTLSLVSGTESYAIPATVLNLDQVQIGTDPPLDIIPWPEYETYKRQFLVVTDTGYPTVCSIYQRKLWFYPTPDQNMTANLRGQESFSALDADADTPDLPADYHRVIQEIAIYLEMLYKGSESAGLLVVSGSGQMTAQGGQAATAVNLFNLVRNNSGDHFQQPPRMMNRYETQNKNALRRIIY
jgi:hypothetical protein